MTVKELINRNKLVKKPMKQKLIEKLEEDETRRPPLEPIAHCSNNPQPIPPVQLQANGNNNPRAKHAFEHATCGARCRKEGCITIPRDYRRRIYDEFSQMTNDEKYFVMRTLMYIRRDSGEQENGSHNKTKSWQYNLVYLEQNLQVCRNNFLGTLGVTKTQVK